VVLLVATGKLQVDWCIGFGPLKKLVTGKLLSCCGLPTGNWCNGFWFLLSASESILDFLALYKLIHLLTYNSTIYRYRHFDS